MSDPADVAPFGSALTTKERTVLRAWWDSGGDVALMALELKCSPFTIYSHLRNIRSRLGASTNLDAHKKGVA